MSIEILLGKIIRKVWYGGDYIIFEISQDERYIMHHTQDCCESVGIEDICGEMDWLLNTPVLRAEERSNEEEGLDKHGTWTFYELATINGAVTIRWYGTSNGYYSERVTFERMAEVITKQ